MITLKSNIAKGLLVLLASYPQLSAAQEFTAAEVLEWDAAAQSGLIQNSISMIAILAAQKGDSGEYAKCVGDWYGVPQTIPNRIEAIVNFWEQYGDYHPQAVILALVEDECVQVFSQ
ncbi:MAG: hypothetical protein AAGF71_06985 [Pseudomonadota bacterium]